MPCGINTLLVAHVYGLDVRLAAQAVAWSTALAVAGALVAAL
jgi:malate permease and related proteins